MPPTTVAPQREVESPQAGGDEAGSEAPCEGRFHPGEEAATVGCGRLPRDHAGLLDRSRRWSEPGDPSVGGVDGHVATGLTRPDVFNWFTHLAAEVKKLRPKVVVLNFGANDDHNYMTGLPKGTSIGSFASPEWTTEYRRRVGGVMDTVNRAGAVVVWIGLPITRRETQTQRFDTINAIVQKEAKARPGKAIFIDTYTMFAGDDGGFAEYIQNAKGDTVKVRAGDGVHFDTAGGDLIAREVLKQLNGLFDLTSWRNQKAP